MALIKKKRKKRRMLEFSLNITSLMDVLTVLLFFLIKSFSVSSQSQTAMEGVHLPFSVAKGELQETITLALNSQGVRADGTKVIVSMVDGHYLNQDIDSETRLLKPLKAYLVEQLKKRNEVYRNPAGSNGEKSEVPPGKVLIQSDKDIPFGILKVVLNTAAESGYSDYQFVVLNPDE